MAFCMYCGAQLADGEEHICPNAPKEKQETTEFNQVNIGTNPMNQSQPKQEETTGASSEMAAFTQSSNAGQQQNQWNNGNMNQTQQNQWSNVNMGQTQQNQWANGNMGQPATPQFDQMKEKSGMYLKQLADAWIGILKSPMKYGAALIENQNISVAVGLFMIRAILTAILGVSIANGYNKILNFFGGDEGLKCNLFLIFIICCAGSVLFTLIYSGLMYIGVQLCKGNATFKRVLIATSAGAVSVSVIQVLSIILYFVSPTVGIIVFFISALPGYIVANSLVANMSRLNVERKPYVYAAVIVVAFILYYLVYKFGISNIFHDGEIWDSIKDSIRDSMGYYNY